MQYGVPYVGGKSKIAKWIVDHIPPAEIFVDIFAGGCAVTHAAMLSGKYQRFIVNDLNPTPQLFIDAINGELEGYSTVPTKEEFHKLKGVDEAIAILYSFNNNRTNYRYSEEIECVLVPAQKMVMAQSLYERKTAYRDFINQLQKYINKHQSVESLKQLGGVERLLRLQQIAGALDTQRITRLQQEYADVVLPDNAIIYADPPYKNCNWHGYSHLKDFSNECFTEWLASAPLTIVSEYTCPDGCIEISNLQTRVFTSRYDRHIYNTERLFVHKRHLEEYQERMKELAAI